MSHPEPRYTRREAAAAAQVSALSARKLYRALGYADVADEPAYSEGDLEALRRAAALVRRGLLDEDTVLTLTRAAGRSLDRLATWHVETVIEAVHGDRAATVELLDAIAPDLQVLLGQVWRRLLADAADRVLASQSEGVHRSVGFADVVGWTQVVQRLDEPDLAALVRRFEEIADEAVAAHGGRIIKTVGDEVMFYAPTVAECARTALELAQVFADDEVVPGVRVGFAHGPVVARLGDLFGTTVNLAARISRLADAGEVLTDAPTAAALTEEPGVQLRALGPRQLRGLGPVALVTVAVAGQSRS